MSQEPAIFRVSEIHTSTSFVELRWRKKDSLRTQDEDFYIVDNIALDACEAPEAIRLTYWGVTHQVFGHGRIHGWRYHKLEATADRNQIFNFWNKVFIQSYCTISDSEGVLELYPSFSDISFSDPSFSDPSFSDPSQRRLLNTSPMSTSSYSRNLIEG